MDTVTIRELRNRGGEVVDRVEAGGHVTVTPERGQRNPDPRRGRHA